VDSSPFGNSGTSLASFFEGGCSELVMLGR
jgi:hypothetical protein